MPVANPTIHEVDFCAQMASAINQLVSLDSVIYPFAEARVEGFGSGAQRRKRKDLRFFDSQDKLILCGEVKLPGSAEGASAVHHQLVSDAELEEVTPLAEWVGQRPESDGAVNIPHERPATLQENPLFGDKSVSFGRSAQSHVDCSSLEQAKLIAGHAKVSQTGNVKLPNDKAACAKLQELVDARLEKARARFRELAESRTGDERVHKQLQETLERWFVVGRDGPDRPDSLRLASVAEKSLLDPVRA